MNAKSTRCERRPLPVDPLVPDVVARLREGTSLVVEAPPGAGKTTRIPPALLELGGQVLVLEPRRLAARLAARRAACELGERLGETVGYQVRFEDATGPRTRLVYMTEGILMRRLLADPELRSVACVVLDEFHERHLEGDLALALLRRLQQTRRPDLRLLVMSATLEAAPVASFLDGCPVVRAAGREHPVSIRYTPVSAEPLEQRVALALEALLREGLDGDVLVFLPGAREIRRAIRACAGLASRYGLCLLPLHGDLPPEQQELALAPGDRPKVVFATNVAESSVTIEGVTAVIDSGLARVASHAPWSGLPRLEVRPISKASANQRAGRAGRTAPGRVIRLYPAEDFARRAERETPEILREDLSGAVLWLLAAGARPEEIRWLDPPPGEALAAATRLLARLGALDSAGRLTATGLEMARLPLEPRLARLVLEAARRGVASRGCAAAAWLSAGVRWPEPSGESGPSDLLWLIEQPWPPRVQRLHAHLLGLLGASAPAVASEDDEALLIAVLVGFPDRLARRRRDNELLLAHGGSARLSSSSVVRQAEFLVALDIEERREQGQPLVRLASEARPEWLLDFFPERVREEERLEWNRAAARVERSSVLRYDELPIAESRGPARCEAASRILAEEALEAGLARFTDTGEIERYRARWEFAAQYVTLPSLSEDDLRAALRDLCKGLCSFAELEAAARGEGMLRALQARLPREAVGLVEKVAPARMRLPSGRWARVEYRRGEPPSIAAKIQELFGERATPKLAGGRVPLVLHLLAPSNRPVQTTTDLESFWRVHYPRLRRELSRRYPRHDWPEDPLSARPSYR
ncbi:MAG: ATP-dependent helicase HrpB [Bryobacterales bacterium]|nr:ATP-dependent helicase HrpB [Bryobacteraceae bacterium]MDW8129239.1 ATP-dependent helicase HrpB [Bryobacterales bacterium]